MLDPLFLGEKRPPAQKKKKKKAAFKRWIWDGAVIRSKNRKKFKLFHLDTSLLSSRLSHKPTVWNKIWNNGNTKRILQSWFMQSFKSYIHQGPLSAGGKEKKMNTLKISAIWETLGRYLKSISVYLFFLYTVTKLKREIWWCLEICLSQRFYCCDLPLPELWRFHFTSHQLCRAHTSTPLRLFPTITFLPPALLMMETWTKCSAKWPVIVFGVDFGVQLDFYSR